MVMARMGSIHEQEKHENETRANITTVHRSRDQRNGTSSVLPNK